MQKSMTSVIALAAASFLLASPAFAQKSKDTLRIAINDPFSTLDSYHFPQDEVGYFVRAMYGTLIGFNEHTGKFVPQLAKAWRRIDPTTLEFDLRDDVVFHSGNKFTSADVKTTIDYLRNPKVKIRFKQRYAWVKEVIPMGPHKVRIVGKKPQATDLSSVAYRFRMYDGKIHDSLKTLPEKASYGRVSASSTGPYKMVFLDRSKGLKMERFDKWYGSKYNRAPIKTIHGIWMPERQAQLAQLFTGGVDALRNVTADNEKALRGRPGIVVTPSESKSIMYMTMDAAGRSANKAMTDIRVRQAMIKAINRQALVDNFIAGGVAAELPKSICFKSTTGCEPTTAPLAYDPAGAKKLLAEAGFANGFDLQLDVFNPIREIAEAVSGDLQKVGIRVKLNPMPLSVYVKKRGRGEFTAFVGYYPTSAQPDVDNMLNFFFGANRDYYKDPIFLAARSAGSTEFNVRKRTAHYTAALDQVNKKSYIFPISELPIVFVHSDKVRLEKNLLSAGERRINDFFWK